MSPSYTTLKSLGSNLGPQEKSNLCLDRTRSAPAEAGASFLVRYVRAGGYEMKKFVRAFHREREGTP